MSAIDETGSPWPGVVYRIKNNSYDQIAANVTTSKKIQKDYNNSNIEKVIIKRRSGMLYVNFNDGDDELLLDMTSLNAAFDAQVVFGCSLNGSGNPQRYFIGTLKNMYVKLYE